MKFTSSKSLSANTLVLILMLAASCAPALSPNASAAENPPSAQDPAASGAMVPTLSPAGTPVASLPPLTEQPFVRVDNLELTIDDQPFRFIGANAPYYGFYEQYGLDINDAIQSASEAGLKVLRIYLAYNNKPWGAKTFAEYDKVLDIAARNGIYVIANLAEGCCFSGNETREEYLARLPYANLTDESSIKDFEEFIKTLIMRENSVNGRLYRDDPTIMAWDIINEPALDLFPPADLHTWLVRMTAYIKTLDQNHLVTIGLNTSPEVYSTPGDHYLAMNVPDLDFFSFHYNLTYSPVAASHLDSIRYRVKMLRSMGKPVVMEEFGLGSQRIFPDNVDQQTLTDWVGAYNDQLDTAFKAGATGALFWGWGLPETKKVLLWWSDEDHDSEETQFVQMLREYKLPPAPPQQPAGSPVAAPLPTQAGPPDVYVLAICTLINRPKQTVVNSNSSVVVVWGWQADTAHNLQEFIDNSVTKVTLDGKDIASHAPYWVANNDPGNFKMYWFARVGALQPGKHLIEVDTTFEKLINDGTDTYGPGGETNALHDECEILIQ